MSTIGMRKQNSLKHDKDRTFRALEILYVDRKNQFQELAEVVLKKKSLKSIPNWKEFVLNFCVNVELSFMEWSGRNSLSANTPQKTLILLRQIGYNRSSMNQFAHLLNISYDISIEFKEIYRRLK